MYTKDKLTQIMQRNNLIEPYSGRGMYGKECFATICNGMQDFLEVLFEIYDDCQVEEINKREVQVLLSHVLTDSLGLDTVYYWPSLKLAK